jgi:hypothetical protein
MSAGIKSLLKNWLGQFAILFVAISAFYAFTPPVEPIKDIEIADGFAYLALGKQGIRIMDISEPDQPFEVGKFNTHGITHDLVLEGQTLIAADGDNGVLIFDISNPAEIKYLWKFEAPKDARAVSLRGENAYVADGADGLYVLNVEQFPPNPDEKYSWRIKGSGLKQLLIEGRHIYGIGLDNAVQIYDLKEPTKPDAYMAIFLGVEINDLSIWDETVFVATNGGGISWFRNPSKNTQAPSGVFPMEGKNILSLDTRANSAYLGIANEGLTVLDVADLGAVAQIERIGGMPQLTAITYQEGIAYVGDGIQGLRTLQLEDNYTINALSNADSQENISGSIEDMRVLNNYVYMASCQHGLNILRLGENYKVQGRYHFKDMSGCAVALDAINNSLIVAVEDKGIRIYNVAENYAIPKLVYDIGTDGAARDVAVRDHFAFVANGDAGLAVVDWEIPIDQVVSQLDLGNAADAQGIYLYGDYAYLASGDAGLKIVNIENPRQPALVATQRVPGYIRSVYVQPAAINNVEGENRIFAFVVGGAKNKPSGLWIYDVTDPRNSRQVGVYDVSQPVLDISVDGRVAYLLHERLGLITLDVSDPARPQLKWSQGLEGDYSRIYRSGRLVYAGRKTDGIQLFQMENIQAPGLVMEFSIGELVLLDVVVVDNYAYGVDGERGLWVLDISKPKAPAVIEFVDTPGYARALAVIGDRLFLADGGRGIRIYGIQNRSDPEFLGSFEAMENAQAIVGKGEYIYVANAQGGVIIFNIADPAKIEPVGSFKTRGTALDIAMWGDTVFVAEGAQGVEAVDVSNPSRPTGITIHTDFSLGNALSLELSPAQGRLFVADGENGLKVFNITNPAEPRLIYELASNGRLQDLSLMSNLAYLADAGGGIRVVLLMTEDMIFELEGDSRAAHHIYWADLAPDKIAVSNLLVFGNQDGLGIYEIERKYKISPKGFAEIPGKSPWRDFLPGGPNPQRTSRNLSMFLGGMLAYLLAGNLMMRILSVMVLPVSQKGESKEVYDRLLSYLFGTHGPVAFAENGKLDTRKELFSNKGDGFIKVDANSAVVLERKAGGPGCILGWLPKVFRRPHPRKHLTSRTEGPGFVFMKKGEQVRGVADLRTQFRARPEVHVHTRDGIEVKCLVFTVFTIGKKPDVLRVTYEGGIKEAEKLRVLKLGLKEPDPADETQYRIQIVKKLEDVLDLDDKVEIHRYIQGFPARQDGEKNTENQKQNGWRPYQYNPKRVFAAVTGRPYDIGDGKLQDWSEIPPFIAVNIFREIISQRLYDEILEPTFTSEKFPIKKMRADLRSRMVNQGILAYEYIEMKTGSSIYEGQEWHENRAKTFPIQELLNRKVLRSRGIKVIAAGFSELQPIIEEVQEHYLFEHWRSPWQQEAVITQSDHELQAMRIKNQARAQAQRDMAYTLSKILQSHEHSREALAVRVYQALEAVAANPNTQQLLPRDAISVMHGLRSLLLPGDNASDVLPPPKVP